MAGTFYTNGGNTSKTAAAWDDYDAIRYSAAAPANPVTITVAANGSADLSDELGTVSATVTLTGGTNTITTGGGKDTVTGGAGADTINGGAGDDTLNGGAGDDILNGGDGNDTITDDDGLFFDSNGTAAITGGAGDDRIDFGFSSASFASGFIDGGADTDTLITRYNDISRLTISNVEILLTGGGMTTATAAQLSAFTKIAWGDRFTLDLPYAVSLTLSGAGTVDLTSKLEGLRAATVYASAAGNTITGGALADTLNGAAGADTLNGGAGNDTLNGGAGNDTLDGGSGDDTAIFSGVKANYTITKDAKDPARGTISSTAEGSDTLRNVEYLQFWDGLYNWATGVLSPFTTDVRLTGGAGNDTITGGSGNDTIIGDDGNDTITGGAGNDYISGGYGNDTLNGGDGNDTISDDSGTFLDSNGTAAITGGAGNDTVDLRFSLNNFTGGFIDGGADTDTLITSLNDISKLTISNIERLLIPGGYTRATAAQFSAFDTIAWGDTATELANMVTLSLSGAGTVDLTSKLEGKRGAYVMVSSAGNMITGGALADTLDGNVAADTLNGGAGDDYIFGNDGDDMLNGGDGKDKLYGDAGSDRLDGGIGNDTIDGGDGSDTAVFSGARANYTILKTAGTPTSGTVTSTAEGTDTVSNVEYLQFSDGVYDWATGLFTGSTSGVTINGTAGDDTISTTVNSAGGAKATSFNDTINGLAGDDSLNGGAGADTMIGGTGDDTYTVDDKGDVVIEDAGAGYDTVNASVTYTIGANVEKLTLAGALSINGTGNGLANTVSGSGGNNVLKGLGGADNLYGGNGNDRLYGGAGNDTLNGGAGLDVFVFDTALNAVTNLDKISDFSVADDTFWLDSHVFTALAPGALPAANFVTGIAATGSLPTIVYDITAGKLFYDADGKGAGAQVQFATLSPSLAITASDFVVI